MSATDKLLPCPFCGGIPIVDCGYHYDYDGGDRYYAYSADVECCCGCTLHVEHDGPKEYVTNEHMLDFAIAAWNRRQETHALISENVKLRELVQRADRLLTDLFPHIDYSRCTALEAVAAWRVRARELGVEVPDGD